MKHSIPKTYIVFFSLVTLFSACAGGADNSATSNSNSAEQANSNAQPGAPPNNGTPLAVQPIPAPGSAPKASSPQPVSPPPAVVKTPAPNNANTAKPATATSGAAPKLIAPAKRLEFGKQPQDKTLVRAIVIRNGGRADLKVESVTPS